MLQFKKLKLMRKLKTLGLRFGKVQNETVNKSTLQSGLCRGYPSTKKISRQYSSQFSADLLILSRTTFECSGVPASYNFGHIGGERPPLLVPACLVSRIFTFKTRRVIVHYVHLRHMTIMLIQCLWLLPYSKFLYLPPVGPQHYTADIYERYLYW